MRPKEQVAFHEVGHAATCYWYHVPLSQIWVEQQADSDCCGGCDQATKFPEEGGEYATGIEVMASGHTAEGLYTGKLTRFDQAGVWDAQGRSDWSRALMYAEIAFPEVHDVRRLIDRIRDREDKVRRFFRRPEVWLAVEECVRALLKEVREQKGGHTIWALTGDDVEHIFARYYARR